MGQIQDFVNDQTPGILKKADKQKIGIAGFVAYVALSEDEVISSSSPDIVLEDGTVISDTIFLKPVTISIEGEVADINISKEESDEIYRNVNNIIGQVTPYLPNRINSEIDKVQEIADTARNTYALMEDAIRKGDQVLNLFKNESGNISNQERFKQSMRKLNRTKQLVDIETSISTYKNMRIDYVKFRQDNTSGKVMFNLNAKQIRQQQLRFTRLGANASLGLGGQAQGISNKSLTQGEKVPESLLSSTIGSIRGLFN